MPKAAAAEAPRRPTNVILAEPLLIEARATRYQSLPDLRARPRRRRGTAVAGREPSGLQGLERVRRAARSAARRIPPVLMPRLCICPTPGHGSGYGSTCRRACSIGLPPAPSSRCCPVRRRRRRSENSTRRSTSRAPRMSCSPRPSPASRRANSAAVWASWHERAMPSPARSTSSFSATERSG